MVPDGVELGPPPLNLDQYEAGRGERRRHGFGDLRIRRSPEPTDGSAYGSPLPRGDVQCDSAVVSLDSPQSQLEHHFSVAHHCGFWAAG